MTPATNPRRRGVRLRALLGGRAAVAIIAMLATATMQPARAQPASSPWPMGGHDAQHTGLSPFGSSGNIAALKWKFTLGGGGEVSSPAIGADGTIYVSSGDSYSLYAINPDGSQKWQLATGILRFSSPAIAADGTIYVGGDSLHAIKSNGSMKWQFTIVDNALDSSPAIGADGTIYVGSTDGNLYAINPDGNQRWKFTVGGLVDSSPAIGTDGTIYVGSGGPGDNLYAVNSDGSLKWQFTPVGLGPMFSPAIGADGTIYVASADGNLYAISPDGTEEWRFTTKPAGGYPTTPAISTDGTIYLFDAQANHSRLQPRRHREVGVRRPRLRCLAGDRRRRYDLRRG